MTCIDRRRAHRWGQRWQRRMEASPLWKNLLVRSDPLAGSTGSMPTSRAAASTGTRQSVANRDLGLDPTRRATVALEAAAHFSAGVSGPFNFVEANDTDT
jgi:hypothetical protein